jgi:transposase
MGRLPEAWIAPAEVRELRELTRYRHKLVGLRTSCKEQVHAVLAKLGIPVTASDLFGAGGQLWLDGLALPQPYKGKVASLRMLAAELSREITLLDTVIADLLQQHDGYHAIQALPGIGPVLGAVIVAEIGDVRRFAAAGRLCSWAGLTPRHRESDVKVARGHITKQGSPILRWAMVPSIPPWLIGRSRRCALSPASLAWATSGSAGSAINSGPSARSSSEPTHPQ